MKRCQQDGIRWLEFEIFDPFPELVHGVILRDVNVAICENRQQLCPLFHMKDLASVQQVHGRDIVIASEHPVPADGLMTQEDRVGLMIQHADCQAAIFYDPRRQVIANVHAGWRGNVQNIYAATLDAMEHRFGSSRSDIRVGISPSLGPCCAEFIHYQKELPEAFWRFQTKPLHFDLWEIARHQLEEGGVLCHHIQIAEVCTKCHPDDYFSYRRQREMGRNATLVGFCQKN